MLAIKKTGRIMNLFVESLQMRIGVQELAAYVGDSALYSSGTF